MDSFTLANLTLFSFFVLYKMQLSHGQVNYGKVILIGTHSKEMEFNQRAEPNGIQQNPKSTRIVDKASKKSVSNVSRKSSKTKQTKSVPNSPQKPTSAIVKKNRSVPNSPHKPFGQTSRTVPNSPHQLLNRTPNGQMSTTTTTQLLNRQMMAYSPHRPSWTDDDEISHSITIMRNDSTEIVAEYGRDLNRDMFQIGRARHEKIDFTISYNARISRFACRIVAERNAPENVYIYAAGFDDTNNIFLGTDAVKIEKPNGQFDGLVTNGVMILLPTRESRSQEIPVKETNIYEEASSSRLSMTQSSSFRARFSPKIKRLIKHPIDTLRKFSPRKVFSPKKQKETSKETVDADEQREEEKHSNKDGASLRWKEVSVTGDIYSQREIRRAGLMGELQPHLTNKLEDGTLIDICGATLLWRSAKGMRNSPNEGMLKTLLDQLNIGIRPQDPVFLHTLQFRRYGEATTIFSGGTRKPHVYEHCGHVQSRHGWRENNIFTNHVVNAKHKCPVCKQYSDNVIKLTIGDEPAFHMDLNALDYAFNPCGHIASKRTVEYWSSIKIPDDHGNFHIICPFCKETLNEEKPNIKLYYSGDENRD